MEFTTKYYEPEVKKIVNRYAKKGMKVNPLFVMGQFFILYGTGHDDSPDNCYTYDLIQYKINERLKNIKRQCEDLYRNGYMNSVLASDVIFNELYDDFFESLNRNRYMAITQKMTRDAYAHNYHTTDLITALRGLKIQNYAKYAVYEETDDIDLGEYVILLFETIDETAKYVKKLLDNKHKKTCFITFNTCTGMKNFGNLTGQSAIAAKNQIWSDLDL
jgi:hypothetical protein